MRRSTLLITGLVVLASLLPSRREVSAQGTYVYLNDRNHPELRWMELRTENFRIFYHDPLEEWAREAASILERFYEPACQKLDVWPRDFVRVYLSDQDQIANGAALSNDYFYVWIPGHASSRSFAGENAWFEEVLIHEFTHILIEEASRSWLGNFAYFLGYHPPRWLHEGVAQWTAESWNVFRGDRTLAAAILDGSIDRNPPGVPGGGRLRNYVRGHARVRWLVEAYGDSTIQKLIRPHGRWGTYSYHAALKEALGKERKGLWDRFRRDMVTFYGDRVESAESPDSLGRVIDLGLIYPLHVVPDGDSTLWIVGQKGRGAREASLFKRIGSGPTVRILSSGVAGRPVPLGDGRVIVPRYHRGHNGSWVSDLALHDPTSGERFLTSNARIGEVAMGGNQLFALADSPYGPSLLRSYLPTADDPGTYESIYPWPRGWVVHSLSVSPNGRRIAFAATEPDGTHGLWGLSTPKKIGRPIRLYEGSETRNSVWIDNRTIATTTHADGLEQIRTFHWPTSTRSATDTLRTIVGVGVAVAGFGNDSLFVLDHTSRKEVPVRRVDPTRRPHATHPAPAYPFDSRPAVTPTSASPRIDGPFPYRALDEVRPWLLLPLIGPQSGDPGLGFAGFWAEPLLHHAFGGYVYANPDQLHHPDRELFYLTSRYGPWLAAFHASALRARRVLDGEILTERRETTGIAALSPLHLESDPTLAGWVDGFLKTDSRRPRFGGRELKSPVGSPTSWSSLIFGGGIGALRIPGHARGATGPREGYGASLRMQAGIGPWGGSTRFFRGNLHAFHAEPLPILFRPTLWTEFRFEGTSTGLPAQEFIGLDSDPSHRILSGWPGLDGTVYLRGWPQARAARYVAAVNLEARFRVLPDLGLRGPGVALYGGSLAPFLEIGHPWGGASASFFDERTRTGIGLEARLAGRIGFLPIVPSVAWGTGFGHRAPKGSWSWRIATSLPFSTPLRPPAIWRALFGGTVHPPGGTDRTAAVPGSPGIANRSSNLLF